MWASSLAPFALVASQELPDRDRLEAMARSIEQEDDSELAVVRAVYHEAVHDSERIDEGSVALQRLRGGEHAVDPAELLAYEGAFEALRGRHARWPGSKLSHLQESRRLLDRAVGDRPDSAEIRYLRFMTEHHVPSLLQRREVHREDGSVLIELLAVGNHALPAPMEQAITTFLDGGATDVR